MAEISVAGGVRGRYDGYGVRYVREGELLLEVHQALFREALDGAAARQFSLSQDGAHVYVFYDEGEAVQL